MEIYLLDDLYRRITVVDKFESLIWTERYSAYGDFELKMQSNFENRSRMKIGTRLTIAKSYRVMTIETIQNTLDLEGRRVLILTGRTLERVLENRLARSELGDLATTPKWIIVDQPADIARQLFHDICITGVLMAEDVLPGITEARMPLIPADTISEPAETITYSIDPMTLYKAVKDICDYYAMGFRLVKHPDTNVLYWDIYMGSDRTSQQTTLPAVIFSDSLDNLSNTKELTSAYTFKNVAYVLAKDTNLIVYAEGLLESPEGFDRNVMFVIADDIEGTDTEDYDEMERRGQEALAKNRKVSAFDGELNQNSKYVYGIDYNLGDLVEFQSQEGSSSIMQVTEQIFVSDKEGDRSYPTLVINSFVVEGAWNTAPPDLVWNDIDPDAVWNDGL